MSVEENKAVVRRLLEAVNQQDLATIDALAAPEVARSTKEELIPFIYGTFGPQHHMEIVAMIGEGDQVWTRVATSGGHVKEWMGIPPTGTAWTNTVIAFARVVDGKVVETEALPDIWNHVTQLGATLAPPQGAATGG